MSLEGQAAPYNRRLLCFDFDGTVKPRTGPVAELDKQALRRCGEYGWVRVVVTGRSLYSFTLDWEPDLAIDYLIFSSGLGVAAWGPEGRGEIIKTGGFSQEQAQAVVLALAESAQGFFAHGGPSLTEGRLLFRPPRENNPDFQRRLASYRGLGPAVWPKAASIAAGFESARQYLGTFNQFLVMAALERAESLESLFRARLGNLVSIIKVSSPLGGPYRWLELMPPGVCKSAGASFLAGKLGLAGPHTIAFGNDYNDQDLLDWAGRAYITSDAPRELTKLYPARPPAGEGGLAKIIDENL